jgi:hypothetical protein
MSFERPMKFFREGIGNINYGQPPGSGGGGGSTITGAQSGVSVVGTNVELGQLPSQFGAPGQLLRQTEIPLNGFNLFFATQPGARLFIAPAGDAMLNFDQGTTTQQPITIFTRQGLNPAPGAPFGNFQISIDQAFTNPDGQTDAVLSIGYNTDGGDGRLNVNEASLATVLESHFQQGGIGDGTFEWYLTSDSKTGVINRHFFAVIDKVSGTASMSTQFDQWSFTTTTGSGNFNYANLGPGGMNLIGPNLQFSLITSTPGDGSLTIEPVTGGITQFIDEGGGGLQFNAACLFETSTKIDGLSNFWFQSSEAADTSLCFIIINTNLDPANPILQIYNNSDIATKGNMFFGYNTGPAYGATAKVHINASTGGAAGTGPLKLVPGTLLAIPEDGLIEYDGTNYYKTIGVVRSIIL